VALGPGFHLVEGELEPPRQSERAEDPEPLGHHLGADAVPADDRDAVDRHRQTRVAARSRLFAISAATRIASTMLSGLAVPLPARSKAVPWSTETRRMGRPTVTLTPERPVHAFLASS